MLSVQHLYKLSQVQQVCNYVRLMISSSPVANICDCAISNGARTKPSFSSSEPLLLDIEMTDASSTGSLTGTAFMFAACCLPFDFVCFVLSSASYCLTSSGSTGRTMHAGIHTRRWLSGSGGDLLLHFFCHLPVMSLTSGSPLLLSSDSKGRTSYVVSAGFRSP